MEFLISFEWLVIGIVSIVTICMTPKIATTLTTSSSKSQRKLQKLDEEYISELELRLKQYKNKANNMERGPQIQGEMSELGQLLPELLGQFGHMAPKWAQPLLKDENMQKWLAEYVTKNPEKAGEFFGKIIKKQLPPQNAVGASNAL